MTIGDALELAEKIEERKAEPILDYSFPGKEKPIIAWEWWSCDECRDTGVTEEWIAPDDSRERACLFCSIGEEPDMTGADGSDDR